MRGCRTLPASIFTDYCIMLKQKKFKIGRRLGPAVFDQCQTERFALSEARKKKAQVKDKHKKNISPYNLTLRDKQRIRFYYGIPERQFKRYIREAGEKSSTNPTGHLYAQLEMRLDNIVYKAGLAGTHRAARQMVSHGHIIVNEKRIRVPSHTVSVGDVIGIREASSGKKLFSNLEESSTQHGVPGWIEYNDKKHQWKISSKPSLSELPPAFNLSSVVEFYSR